MMFFFIHPVSSRFSPLALLPHSTIQTATPQPQHRHTREAEGRNWGRERDRQSKRERETILSPRYDRVTHAERSHMEGGGKVGRARRGGP